MTAYWPTWKTYHHHKIPGAAVLFIMPGAFRIWFYHDTPIAFQLEGESLVVRKAFAGGEGLEAEALNEIDGGKSETRISFYRFSAEVSKITEAGARLWKSSNTFDA